MIASRRCTSPAWPFSHSPAPSGPRGASAAPIRSSASRSGRAPGRSSRPKPHTSRGPPLGGARGGDQRLEQPRVGRALDQRLGVPLHAEQQPRPRLLDRLDHAVRRPGDRPQAAAEPVDGLVVERVDLERRSAPTISASREPGSIRTACVGIRPGRGLAVLDGAVGDVRQMLVQRAAARDVERLAAAADAEDRDAERVGLAGDRELEGVERRLDRTRGWGRGRRRRRPGRGRARRTGRRRRAGRRAGRRRRSPAAAARPAGRRPARPRARRRCRAPSPAAAGRPRAAAWRAGRAAPRRW